MVDTRGRRPAMGEKVYEFKLIERTNNWRKFHGYSMIRYVHVNRVMDARVDTERRKAKQLNTR